MKTTREQKIVTVQTRVDAPVELVWKLWTSPEDIINWNYASDDWHTPRAENDLRPGGKFNYYMEAKDKSQGFELVGTFDKVIPKERIELTLGDGRKVITTFSMASGKTKIIETFEPEKENTVEMQHDGWQAILNNFKKYAEMKSASSNPQKITQKIYPCLWFDDRAEEAVDFYTSVIPNSRILRKSFYTKEGFEIHHHKEGTVLTIDFQLNGQSFTVLNGGPEFKFSEAISLQLFCDSQEEIDYYWEKLTTNGGQEGQCGWLKDKYGLSWQIIPSILPDLITDPLRAEKVMKVLMTMKKLEIKNLVMA